MAKSNATGAAQDFEVFDRRADVLEKKRVLLDCFFSESRGIKRYILGRNRYSNYVIDYLNSQNLRVDAILDDFTSDTHYRQIPIAKVDNVDLNNAYSILVSCVVDAKAYAPYNRLRKDGAHVVDYFALALYYPEKFDRIHHWDDNSKDILENRQEYCWVYNLLADKLSKDTYKKVVDFRFNYDIDLMDSFSLRTENQYFEDFLNIGPGEIFIDGGGFDAQTSVRLLEECPECKKIYYFEPIAEMLQFSKKRLFAFQNIEYFQKCLHASARQVYFDNSVGTASRITSNGIPMDAVSIDETLRGAPVTLIKLDIEGAEYDALLGAQESIIVHKPKLAICIYHRQEHFWRIPKLIMSWHPDYQVYVRHYTQGTLETVMFFVPPVLEASKN